MGLQEEIQELRAEVKGLYVDVGGKKLPNPKKYNLPFLVKMKAAKSKKPGKILVIWLGSDRKIDYRVCDLESGIVKVGDYHFKPYESKAVYHYKKWPVCVVLEDRLTMIGSSTDDLLSSCLVKSDLPDSLPDSYKDEFKKLNDYAQQIIIRVIEKTEVDKELGKKKGKLPIVWIVIGIGVLLYFLAPLLGF